MTPSLFFVLVPLCILAMLVWIQAECSAYVVVPAEVWAFLFLLVLCGVLLHAQRFVRAMGLL